MMMDTSATVRIDQLHHILSAMLAVACAVINVGHAPDPDHELAASLT